VGSGEFGPISRIYTASGLGGGDIMAREDESSIMHRVAYMDMSMICRQGGRIVKKSITVHGYQKHSIDNIGIEVGKT